MIAPPECVCQKDAREHRSTEGRISLWLLEHTSCIALVEPTRASNEVLLSPKALSTRRSGASSDRIGLKLRSRVEFCRSNHFFYTHILLSPESLQGFRKTRTMLLSRLSYFVLLAIHWSTSQAWSPGLQNCQRLELQRSQNNNLQSKPLCAVQFSEDEGDLEDQNQHRPRSTAEESMKKDNPAFPAMLTESWMEDGGDRRAVRTASSHSTQPRTIRGTGHDWGIHQQDKSPDQSNDPVPPLPDTLELVANQANDAIIFSLLEEHSEPFSDRIDPHILNNLWAGDRFWQHRRPVRKAADRGRIGIEIDGILPSLLAPTRRMTRSSTIRSVSLLLAGKLAVHPEWTINNQIEEQQDSIPILIYFNTIKQALWASHELSQLKQMHVSAEVNPYDSVSILALGDEGGLPSKMIAHTKQDNSRKKARPYRDGSVDPSRGIVIVVEPSDFHQEYKPPGPSIGAVERLQKLASQTALVGLPMVVISPRFAQSATGWDQSGYTQSATFGGLEPPRGPTPWILRDFVPPVYSWVGKVVGLAGAQRDSSPAGQNLLSDDDEVGEERSGAGSHYCYLNISMTQSVLHRQRAWHIYGVRTLNGESPPGMTPKHHSEYLASTQSSAGRPTKDVCTWIGKEFASF